jgi:4-amino-4-deoxy-L-arabinose transferase-like glycosyltransferase
MTQETRPDRLDRLARGWRGPLFAALVALIVGLPGMICLPALDRDESLFAQATVQMLETGDFVSIRYQDHPRDKKPVAINWLQAASAKLFTSLDHHRIWAFRIPSLLGAMLAAASLAWGVSRYYGSGVGLVSGAILASTYVLSTEADIAKTDAVLCGATTLTMAAFARLYADTLDDGGLRAGGRTRLLFWAGLALGILDKGPITPLVALLAGLMLWAWDRRARWAHDLGWGWGLILIAAVVGPWAVAITVKTDGAFWTGALGGDLGPKLTHGDAGHGAPPGYHSLLALALFFPFTALLPAALVNGWKARLEPGVKFALCWLVPTWLMFEIMPTKLPHYTLPAYGALAWLAALAVMRPIGRISGVVGAILSLLIGIAVAVVAGLAQTRFGSGAALGWSIATEVLAVAAGLAGAAIVLAPRAMPALISALALGAGAHAVLAAGEAPRLGSLWLSRRIVNALDHVRLNPRGGLIPGPVTVVGYAEPSLVFGLGTETEFGDVGDAADAISEGRPVVIEQRQDAAFQKELADDKLKATAIGTVSGLDYSINHNDMLTIYRADTPPASDADDTPPSQGSPQ